MKCSSFNLGIKQIGNLNEADKDNLEAINQKFANADLGGDYLSPADAVYVDQVLAKHKEPIVSQQSVLVEETFAKNPPTVKKFEEEADRPQPPAAKEPLEPKPEGYGLDKTQVQNFELPEWFKKKESSQVLSFEAVFVMMVVFMLSFALFQGYAFLICLAIGQGMQFFKSKRGDALYMKKIKNELEIWRRSQPKYPNYQKYKLALAQYSEELDSYKASWRAYEQQLNSWNRLQDEWWYSLDGTQFEVEIASLLEKRGHSVRRTGKSGDQGIDLVLEKDGNIIIVQCKAHKSPVGPGPVRDLYGVFSHLKGEKRLISACLISLSGFSSSAREFARGKPIRLIHAREIYAGSQIPGTKSNSKSLKTSISASKADRHLNKYATVQGSVFSVFLSQNGNIFLNLDGIYPRHALTGVVFAQQAHLFPDVESLQGKIIRISGTIQLYRKTPTIIIKEKNQVQVVR